MEHPALGDERDAGDLAPAAVMHPGHAAVATARWAIAVEHVDHRHLHAVAGMAYRDGRRVFERVMPGPVPRPGCVARTRRTGPAHVAAPRQRRERTVHRGIECRRTGIVGRRRHAMAHRIAHPHRLLRGGVERAGEGDRVLGIDAVAVGDDDLTVDVDPLERLVRTAAVDRKYGGVVRVDGVRRHGRRCEAVRALADQFDLREQAGAAEIGVADQVEPPVAVEIDQLQTRIAALAVASIAEARPGRQGLPIGGRDAVRPRVTSQAVRDRRLLVIGERDIERDAVRVAARGQGGVHRVRGARAGRLEDGGAHVLCRRRGMHRGRGRETGGRHQPDDRMQRLHRAARSRSTIATGQSGRCAPGR